MQQNPKYLTKLKSWEKTISLKKVSVQKEVQKKESQFESIKISAYSFEKFVR